MEFGHLLSEKTRFSELAASCISLSSSNSEEDRRKAIDILDQLNGFNYHHHIAFDARQVSRLIHSSTRLVHPTDKTTTAKVIKLVLSLVHRQGISLSTDTSDEVIRWMARVLHHQDNEGKAETLVLLQTLSALLIEAGEQTDEVYIELAGDKGCLTMFCNEDTPWNIRLAAIQCLHHLTYLPSSILVEAWQNGEDIFPPRMVQIVQGVLVKLLQQSLRQQEKQDCTMKMYLQITAAALGVLYNLVVCSPNEILDNILINTCRPYIFFGLPGFLHQDMLKNTIPALMDIPSTTGTESDTSSRSYTNRNRRKRLRRKKAQPSLSQSKSEVPIASSSSFGGAAGLMVLRTPEAAQTFKPAWASKALDSSDGEQAAKHDHGGEELQPTSSSDMESSDPDGVGLGGEVSTEKESSLSAKVRKCALQTINAVIKKVGKQNKFSYWPTLMCQNPSLMTCTLKDPNVGVRMEALQVISTFLLDSSQVLMLAVDDNSEGRSAYTTFGHQLGSSIRELHRCLALILLSEKLQGALVPTLKTIELLVENVNYSKLKPGLLTKLVTHVKYFMRHEAVLVKANAFSVMVSVLMIKPQVQELQDLLTRYQTRLSTPLKNSPSVVAQPREPMDEMFPEDEELLAEFESTTISSENESDREEKSSERNTVSWLIQRCVDSLITPDNEAVRGFYIQVQLQSLKVLSCLCSEHLPLIKDCIGLIQKVIYICTTTTSSESSSSQSTPPDYPQHPRSCGDGQTGADGTRIESDTYLMSSDHGVIAEHSFSLLGTLLESLKEEVNKGEQGSFTVQQQQQLWLWALQGPLQYLIRKAQVSTGTEEQEAAALHMAPSWCQTSEGSGSFQGNTCAAADDKNVIPGTSDRHAAANVGNKQLVAAAVVLSHLNAEIFESLGDDWMSQLLTTILWLVRHSDPDLSLAGVRVMAVVVSFPAVISHSKGITVLQETTKATTNILRQKESNVNKDRHLAAWALANVSSVLDQYRESWEVCKGQSKDEYVLPLWLLCAVVEVGVQACNDKDKIKPHGVRCVGNIIKHLNQTQVLNPKVMTLLNGAVEVLLKSVSTGKSMKTRWNACYALGNILSSDNLPLSEMAWRSKVIIMLASLVENCKHYKVSIQACSAVCSLTSRQEYGKQYLIVWQALFQGLDRAQNIADYHEIRHREELINQICQGICQLTCLLSLEDATSTLYELLLVHQDTTQAHMARAHQALPPERAAQAIHAHMHVGTLLTQSDALTDIQEGTLNVLLTLTENV